MKVGLFYDNIDNEWIYTGFERQVETLIKTQKDAINIFISSNDYYITQMIESCYEGNCKELVIYMNITDDGKQLSDKNVSIVEFM